MYIETLCTEQSSVADAISELKQKLAGKAEPSLLMLYINEQHEHSNLQHLIKQQFSTTKFIGCTSCQGVMSHTGVYNNQAVGMMALGDEQGVFGVGFCEYISGDDKSASIAGKQALTAALSDSGRAGELPAFILLHASPPNEEAILQAITELVGNSVPVIGGSAADDKVNGNWCVFSSAGQARSAVSIAVCYPSCDVALSFYSGYEPNQHSGVVTKVSGRDIITIDNKPAAQVYSTWTNGLDGAIAPDTNIFTDSTLLPLARQIDSGTGYPFYILSHPERVTAESGLRLFSQVQEGETVYLMHGSKESLITRAGRVTQSALNSCDYQGQKIYGSLIIYCAGCRLCLHDEMPQVVTSLNNYMNGSQFLGVYSFGEQGQLPNQANAHANLMISALLFLERC